MKGGMKMKKKLILSAFLVGIFAVSLVSAGWFGDFFGRVTSTGNVVNRAGIPIDEDTLLNGIGLSRGSNYYFIWEGGETPMSEVVRSLDGSIRYIREMPSYRNGRRSQYWYGEGNSRNSIESFRKREKYLIYMNKDAVWKTEYKEIVESNFDGLKYVYGGLNEYNTCGFPGECVRYDAVYESSTDASVKVYVIKHPIEDVSDFYNQINDIVTNASYECDSVSGVFSQSRRIYEIDIQNCDGEEHAERAFIWRTNDADVTIWVRGKDASTISGNVYNLLEAYLKRHQSILPGNSPAPIKKSTGGAGGGHSGTNHSYGGSSGGSSGNRFPIKECSPLVFTGGFDRTMNGNRACQEVGKHCLIAENKGMAYKVPSGEPSFASSVYISCEQEFGRWLDEAGQMNMNNQTSGVFMEPEVHVICCLPN
jgi:hypothetical protein